jgi:capsule biosynthesis phosphatase
MPLQRSQDKNIRFIMNNMHVFILCGGKGTRLEDYSYPKPLNMIHGIPSITYCLQYLTEEIKTLNFIVAPHLRDYNFEEIVINQFKNKLCNFYYIPYFTRGAVESAFLGVKSIVENGDPVVFLDNDVIYKFPKDFFERKTTAFLGYAKDTTGSEAYSFMTLSGEQVTCFKEKKRISDNFCCGVYGFKNITQFREYAQRILKEPTQSEYYFSRLFEALLDDAEPVKGIYFEGAIYHIGSRAELEMCWPHIEKKHMTVCFDLDNTLVTYPSIPGDYRTVKPIPRMIGLAQKLKSEGHTIIIHTARRMATHKNDVAAVIQDVGKLTIQSLKDLNIPYDELKFGKPLADMYIDDRAVNPYRDTVGVQGYLSVKEPELPLNMIPTNKHNTVEIQKGSIIKTGPAEFLSGEIYFYEAIPAESPIAPYFPKYFTSLKYGDRWKLVIENIPGIPLYKLFQNELMTEHHIVALFEFTDKMHTLSGPIPSDTDMMANYIDKLKRRFAVIKDYPFEDAAAVQSSCLEGFTGYRPQGVGFIHGDLWFSNILVDFKNALKMIDMKGRINCIYTTGGDRLYDFGKLYQSFLGYDAVLYNEPLSESYRSHMETIFLNELKKRSISIDDVKRVTFSLIMGTFHAISDINTKNRLWSWIKRTLLPFSETIL